VTIRIVRLGSERLADEGLRIGTVRRPPRGVPKAELGARDWYDLWFPNLAPSADTLKQWKADPSPAQWPAFSKRYLTEMATPENRHTIALLAALSQQTNLSVGCYCADEAHCHRSLLRVLLLTNGARLG
jgi:uncharacterized protein YeaO (DUF488 family)